MIDALVIGGGIAGASVAYFLARRGLSVSVMDECDKERKASLAAGAFINPVMGKPSRLKDFADEAFRFSICFYSTHFPHLYNKCGSLIYPKNEKTKEEYAALGSYIPSSYEFWEDVGKVGAFFVKDAGIINPSALIEALLSQSQVVCEKAVDISKIEGGWRINGHLEAKTVVLAQGSLPFLLDEPYIKEQTNGLWGQRCKIKTRATTPYNISSKVLIAATEGGLVIGATHIRSKKPLPIEREYTLMLVDKAREVLDIGEYEVIEEVGGMRAVSIDHFPLTGKVYDSVSTLKRLPSLIHGARVSSDEIVAYDGLFVHTGHGSRAFMLAPYTAQALCELITNGKAPQKEIDPARLLFRYFKKRVGAKRLNTI